MEKKADVLIPALVATSIGASALKTIRETSAKKILAEALAKQQALKRKAVAAALAAGGAGAAAGYVAGKGGEKTAIDPLMLGLGGAATALTTALTAKQIQSQMALTQAVQKTQAAKKALIAALAGAGAAGAVGGYALGKKQPKKVEKTTEKTVILQPMVVTPDEVPMKMAALRALRRMVDPMVRRAPFMKAKGPMGRELTVSTILNDVQASGAGK